METSFLSYSIICRSNSFGRIKLKSKIISHSNTDQFVSNPDSLFYLKKPKHKKETQEKEKQFFLIHKKILNSALFLL